MSAPKPPAVLFSNIPAHLRRHHRWLLWRYDRGPEARWQKTPYRLCGRQAAPGDSRSWTTFPLVQEKFEHHLRRNAPYDGVAFVAGGGFAAVELHDVFDGSRALLPWAAELVARFATYTELAPGGRGLTLFVLAADGQDVERIRHPAGGSIAVVRQPRFVPVTGRHWPEQSGHDLRNRTDRLERLIDDLRSQNFHKAATVGRAPAPPIEEPEQALGNASKQTVSPNTPALSPVEEKHQTLSPPFIPSSLHPFIAHREAPPATLAEPALCETQPTDATDPRLADQIIELALSGFRLGRTPADESFAVPLDGPSIAHMIRGGSAPLRKALAREFYRRHNRALSSSALSDALNVIDAQAGQLEPEEVHLRVANLPETRNTKHETPSRDLATAHGDGIVIDLGTTDGRAVVVTAHGWRIVDRSPVLFRRTPLTAQLPLPVAGGRLDQLRALVNVSDEGWQLLRGWLVAALFPSMAHPVLFLRGEPGTGKSTAFRMLMGLVDPSAAPLRSEPNDVDHWVMMAHGSWCLALDNISSISPWFSDALCKAVTGDGVVRRRLYTDGDFSVLEFRRVIGLSTVALGDVAPDLAQRLLFVELEPIPESVRLPETGLLSKFEALRPRLFGALLDEVAAVLHNLPNVQLAGLPRMADFARLLAALPQTNLPKAATAGRAPAPPTDDQVHDSQTTPRLTEIEPPGVPPLIASSHHPLISAQARPSPIPSISPTPAARDAHWDALRDAPNAIRDARDARDADPLTIYLKQIKRLAEEVIESDPVALAVAEFMHGRQAWLGTATELHAALVRPESTPGWPKMPHFLTARLNRLATSLRAMGITVNRHREPGDLRTRRIQITTSETQ